MTGRTARKWSGAWIPKLVFDEVVHGLPGEPALIEVVHARINAAMERRGYRWLRHLWVTEEEWAKAGRKKEEKNNDEMEG